MSDVKEIRILIRKAGIGDILTLTPGLRGLRVRYPKSQNYVIRIFVPTGEDQQILLGNPDIDSVKVGTPEKRATLDITEYPANYESRAILNIKKSRIELYNEALKNFTLKNSLMVLKFTPEELLWAKTFCRKYEKNHLICIQAQSGETYKDWSLDKFRLLCQLIKRELPSANIFSFGKTSENISHQAIPLEGTLRQQAAIVACCDFLVAPDSVLLHLGGAFQIPTLLILGPSGWRAKYPKIVVAQRQDLPCCPCFMNASMRCNPKEGMQRLSLGGLENAMCLQEMKAQYVFEQFKLLMNRYPKCDRSEEQ